MTTWADSSVYTDENINAIFLEVNHIFMPLYLFQGINLILLSDIAS